MNGGEPRIPANLQSKMVISTALCAFDPDTFRQLTLDITGRNETPYLSGTVIADGCLFARLHRFHQAVAAHADAMECEALLLCSVRRLLELHVENRRQTLAVGQENSVVSRVRDYIESHYSENISLTQLGLLTSRSPFQITRAFSKTNSACLHMHFSKAFRIRHAQAKCWEVRNESRVDTALAAGSIPTSKSHFTHRFRSITGVTPASMPSAQSSARSLNRKPITRRITQDASFRCK